MQLVDSDFLTVLRASARDLIVLYEVYAADYDISLGFDPRNAIKRFASQTYSFIHLFETVSYTREVPKDFDLKIEKTINKKFNSISLKFSNVDRSISDWILSTDVQGLRFVARAISRSISDPITESPYGKSVILFVGRMERPDGFTYSSGTISARPDIGNIEAQVPPRDFETICPLTFKGEECLGTETLSQKSTAYKNALRCNKSEAQCIEYSNQKFRQGINLVQITSSFVHKDHQGFFKKLLNYGALGLVGHFFGRRHSTVVGNSIFNATPMGDPIPLIMGRVSKGLIPLQYQDTGETINFKVAAGRGPIADVINVRSNNLNFSQPLSIIKHKGEYGGEGTQTADTIFPGGSYLSRLAYITGSVVGSDVEQEDPVPDVSGVVAGITVRMYSDVQHSGTGKLLAGTGGVTLPGSASSSPGTPAATYDLAISSRSPVAYYKLEDAAGPTITDSSGNGNSGSYNAAATFHESGPIETDATSYAVGGKVGVISAPMSSAMDLTDKITIACWGLMGSSAPYTLVIRNGLLTLLKSNFIYLNFGGVQARLTVAATSYDVLVPNVLTVGDYPFVVLTRDGSRMCVYVNGCLGGSRDDLPNEPLDFSAWGGYTAHTNWNLGVTGPAAGVGEVWAGVKTSHVSFFNYAWTPSDVADVWASAVLSPTGCPGNDWTDNPVDHARYMLTDPAILNNPSGAIDDYLSSYAAAYNCGSIKDETNAERCLIPSTESASAGTKFKRYYSTGLLGPLSFESTRAQIPAGVFDREATYETFDPASPPTSLDTVVQYRKRFTANLELREKGKALDVLYDQIFPSFRGFLKWNRKGQAVIDSERPADHTFLLAAAVPADTTIKVRDVLPWKNRLGSPYLLEGKILIGANLDNSEVRSVSSVTYSADGNSITLASSASGGPTATASGANLSGGSTTVQASATVTITGSLTAAATVTVTVDGIDCVLTLVSGESSSTIGLRMAAVINADPVLQKYIEAQASTNVVTIYAKVGVLTLSSALAENHHVEIANPTTAPTLGTSSGSLAAGIYLVAYAYRNSNGTTEISDIAAVSFSGTKKIDVTSLGSLPAGVTSVDWFISRSANSTDLGFVANNSGSGFSITSLPETTAVSAPTINSTGEEVLRVMMSFADRALTYADTTRANILKDSFTWPDGAERSEINQIKAPYIEAILDFAIQPSLTINDTPHQERMRKVNTQDVDLTAVDNYNQAARLGNGLLNTLRDGDFFYKWGSIGEALLLEEGDVVCVSHSSGGTNGFRNKPVRLKTLQINKVPEIQLGGREYKTIHYGDLIATVAEGAGGTGSIASLFVPSTNPGFDSPPDISFNTTDFPPDGLIQTTAGADITSIRGGAIFGASSFGQFAKVRLIMRAGVVVDEIINPNLRPNSDREATFEFIASEEGLYTVELEVCNNRNQCNTTKPTASITIAFGALGVWLTQDGGKMLTQAGDYMASSS